MVLFDLGVLVDVDFDCQCDFFVFQVWGMLVFGWQVECGGVDMGVVGFEEVVEFFVFIFVVYNWFVLFFVVLSYV